MDTTDAYQKLEAVRSAVQALHAALKAADDVVALDERAELTAFRNELDDLWHDYAEGLHERYGLLSDEDQYDPDPARSPMVRGRDF